MREASGNLGEFVESTVILNGLRPGRLRPQHADIRCILSSNYAFYGRWRRGETVHQSSEDLGNGKSKHYCCRP